MNTRELLTHLSKLENGLDSFSFSELNTTEAKALKKSFESFKNGLETKVFGGDSVAALQADALTVTSINNSKEHTVIANVSHEIRTPLNGIVGFVDLLKETPLTQKQFELTNALSKASQNLMDIVNELLEFSKLAAGREKFAKVPFNLKNLVNEVGFLCRTLITNKDITLQVTMDEGIPHSLIGDPAKLSQILLNLMGNSVKFVEKGKIQLKVHFIKEENNEVFLDFDVVDTGIGIANDKLNDIFETYQQAEPDTQLKYGGSGLGLSIVKELIGKMKGQITVQSTLGRGTVFKVTLPFEKASTDDVQQTVTKQNKRVEGKGLEGTKVLVFEDNTLNQKLMENRLKNWGCETIITANGLYGLKLLENHHFDMVLMDLRMPGMNGFEITRRIRNNSNYMLQTIPIIAISADMSASDKDKCHEYGVSDFILKPYNSDELQNMMGFHLNQNRVGNTGTPNNWVAGPKMNPANLAPILEECLGQIELLDELIRLFKQNMLEFIGKVKMHLQNNNLQGIGFAAHKIKSSLKMMEASSLFEICETISETCKESKDTQALTVLYHRFLEEYPKVEKFIDLEIKKLK